MKELNYKLNILVVHNKYKQRGGEDVVVENEIPLLEEMGFSVYEYVRTNEELDHMGIVDKMALPFRTLFSIKTYREIKKIIKEKDIDILHIHNTLLLISPSVYYAGFNSHIPVFQTIHNFRLLCPNALLLRDNIVCEECIEKGVGQSVKYSCYRGSKLQTMAVAGMLYLHRNIGTYNKINYICLSEFNKNKLLTLNKVKGVRISPEQVFVKPNFIKKTNVKEELRSEKYFLFVGRLSIEKGILDLLKAWEKYDKISDGEKLIICGDGPQVNSVLKAASSMNSIQYVGNVSKTDVLKYMSGARALIVSSIWYEAGPLTVIEAFSMGCPVVGCNIGNVKYIVEEGVTGTKFEPNDPDSIVDALVRFDLLEAEELRANAYKYYDEHYSVEKNKELFREIYNNGKVY